MMEEEKKESRHPAGEMVRFVRINEKGGVDFLVGNQALCVALPKAQVGQLEVLMETNRREQTWFWLVRTRRDEISPWRGLILAGPYQEISERNFNLLSKEDKGRWFDQLSSSLAKKLGGIEDVYSDLVGQAIFETGQNGKIGFRDVWNAFRDREKVAVVGQQRYAVKK